MIVVSVTRGQYDNVIQTYNMMEKSFFDIRSELYQNGYFNGIFYRIDETAIPPWILVKPSEESYVNRNDIYYAIGIRQLDLDLRLFETTSDLYSHIEMCLKYGADLNVRSLKGDTVLGLACAKKNYPAIELLINNGAKVEITSPNVLTDAIVARDTIRVQLLLPNMSNLNSIVYAGNTALGIAVSNNNLEITSILLKAGAGPNVKSLQGDTPLHMAVTRGNLELVMLLIEYQADQSDVNRSGLSPIELASRLQKHDIVEYLRSVQLPDKGVY